MNRYKLGRLVEDTLYVTPFESLFLFIKGRIRPENPFYSNSLTLMKELLPGSSDLILYTVYEQMKLKGLYVKKESDSLFFRKSPRNEYDGPMKVMRESRDISFQELASLSGSLVATVDDENDTTFFRVYGVEPEGSADLGLPGGISTDRISDRHVAQSEGMPDWIGNDFRGVRFLTELEECLVKEGKEGGVECSENPLFRIYSDLIGRRLIVKTGFKYGTNFRAYTKTMEEHADYLIHFLSGRDEWYKISRAVRVSQGVHKIMIFAGFLDEEIKYVAVERIRDPFYKGQKND
ncbi:hypothetical protein IX51_01430 [uncultured archaeon]|nr:hypothetical protein IX51_01430 [uncultured archaeon]